MNTLQNFFTSLNWADYLILVIIGLSILRGIRRGFVKEALSLVTWILALVISIKFYTPVSLYLEKLITAPSVRMTIAFVAIFLAILIIGNILSRLLSGLINKIGLSLPNRLIGILFGALRGVLIVVLLIILAKLTAVSKDEWWKKSVLIPQGEKVVEMIKV